MENKEKDKVDSSEKENNQTIIIKDDVVKSPYAASWASFWFYLKKLKYWVIGITLIFTILSFTAIQYIYNANNSEFSVSFSYKNLPFKKEISSDGSVNYNYLDGSKFTPGSIISETNMLSVIENSKKANQNKYLAENPSLTLEDEKVQAIAGDYDDVDYKKITSENLMMIEEDGELTYTISGKSSIFSSDKEATAFIKDLIQNAQISSVYSNDSNFFTYLDNFNSDTSYRKFENQLANLQEEIEYLFEYYNIFVNYYTATDLVINGQETTIEKEFAKFKTATDISSSSSVASFSIVSNVKSTMTYSLNDASNTKVSFVYLGDSSRSQDDYKYYFNSLIDNVDSEIDDLSFQISNLTTENTRLQNEIATSELPTSTISVYNSQISSNLNKISNYTSLKNEYAIQKALYTRNLAYVSQDTMPTVEDEKYVQFVNSIDSVYNTLYQQAERLTLINSAFSETEFTSNAVSYINSGVLETEGEISWYIGALIGVILGLLVSSVIVLIYGQEERRKAYYFGEPDPIIPVKKVEEKKEEVSLNQEEAEETNNKEEMKQEDNK